MKINIISFSLLLCLTVACGITNSKKNFNPEQLNGLYMNDYLFYFRRPDSSCAGEECYGQRYYRSYISVDYPRIQVCLGSGRVELNNIIGKEDVRVGHKNDNLYKIKEINGTLVNNKDVTYKIRGDSSRGEYEITHYLHINKIKNGNEYYRVDFKHEDSDIHISKEFQECLSQAPDTTGIFPSAQKYAVKQN